jgi:hypothetical protein
MAATSDRKNRFRRSVGAQAPRLAAIRTIVDLVDDGEDQDVVTEALIVLGASRQEIAAATFDGD